MCVRVVRSACHKVAEHGRRLVEAGAAVEVGCTDQQVEAGAHADSVCRGEANVESTGVQAAASGKLTST
jgi:hypothetical protein